MRKPRVAAPEPDPVPPPPAVPEVMIDPVAEAAAEHLPQPDTTIAGASGGRPYVRMLSPTGHVRPVIAIQVADRLIGGFKFIEGEPTVPRDGGVPTRCDADPRDGSYRPTPCMTPVVYNETDALSVWLRKMSEDFAALKQTRRDLLWAWLPRVSGQYRARKTGTNPLGDLVQ